MYKAEVTYTSKELTKLEEIKVKQMQNVPSLGDIMRGAEEFIIDGISHIVKVHVENDRSDSKEYYKTFIYTYGGNVYSTGSESVTESLIDLMNDLADFSDDEKADLSYLVKSVPSKNNSGNYLTIQLV